VGQGFDADVLTTLFILISVDKGGPFAGQTDSNEGGVAESDSNIVEEDVFSAYRMHSQVLEREGYEGQVFSSGC
jgi:hypothetical protein